jgi:hypothetical protein
MQNPPFSTCGENALFSEVKAVIETIRIKKSFATYKGLIIERKNIHTSSPSTGVCPKHSHRARDTARGH